jgi:hypothetical protein
MHCTQRSSLNEAGTPQLQAQLRPVHLLLTHQSANGRRMVLLLTPLLLLVLLLVTVMVRAAAVAVAMLHCCAAADAATGSHRCMPYLTVLV